MEFNEAIAIVKTALSRVGSRIETENYDGLIVKKLESSNTLDTGRSTNQTHIAITGNQMDLFPYIRADGYFEVEYDNEDLSLKKYFVAQIPVYLHRENALYLAPESNIFSEEEKLVHVSIVRSRRKNAADQIQMSIINIDTPEFVNFRKLIHAKSYMVLLKRKQQLIYDMFVEKEADGNDTLKDINNGFYKLSTSTPVKLDEFLLEEQRNKNIIELPFYQSKECARQIVDLIYEFDEFERLMGLLENNDKNIKLNTDIMSGNYLRYMFAKPTSSIYNNESGGKTRVFTDKDYMIKFGNVTEQARLSTEWVSSKLGENRASANYLRALIEIVNLNYADVINIYEDSGKWFLEHLCDPFKISMLPEVFQSLFAKRYIKSLLAKPFVILTGNSGTGKTRISKQFAEYLEINTSDGDKNWVLVPVGADWTDNTKILGFYNPLADEGRGRYEKTEILKLIERANKNRNIPYFLILDEMNLSHVERYFSDFLSHMETQNVPLVLDGCDEYVNFPTNLYIIGTVNIDETTYMFSPKVLDRANVIEFKPDEESVMDLFLNPSGTSIINPANHGIAEAFLKLTNEINEDMCRLDRTRLTEVQDTFKKVYEITEKYGYEFAYRTVKEIRRYISVSFELAEDKNSFDLIQAEDEQLLQKILPKIHGNKKEIGKLLDELEDFCNNNNFKLSGNKVQQMKGKLATSQYASFI